MLQIRRARQPQRVLVVLIVRAVKGARYRDLAELVSVASVGHVIAVDHDAARGARKVVMTGEMIAAVNVVMTDVTIGARRARVMLASHDLKAIANHAELLARAHRVKERRSVGPVDLVAGLSASRERGAGPGLITTVVTRGEAAAAVTARLVSRGARIVTKGPLVVSREGEVRASRLAARRISTRERITCIANVNRIS